MSVATPEGSGSLAAKRSFMLTVDNCVCLLFDVMSCPVDHSQPDSRQISTLYPICLIRTTKIVKITISIFTDIHDIMAR